MTVKINTHFGQPVTSEMLNEKISCVTGENIKLDGFSIKKVDNLIIVDPGKCIISGAIIEKTDRTSIPVPEIEDEIFILIKYFHYKKKIEFLTSATDDALEDELVIGSIKPTDSLPEILNAKPLKTMRELSRAYKSLRNNLLLNQEVAYGGEEIICDKSIEGNITDFKIKGNTVLNLAPIKDKTPIFAKINKAGERIPIQDSKCGHINGISVKGNTLRNLIDPTYNRSFSINADKTLSYINIGKLSLLKPNRTYSYILYGVSNKINKIYLGDGLSKEILFSSQPVKKVVKFTPKFTPKLLMTPHFYGENITEQDLQSIRMMILEGDWTNRDLPEHFEGIKSVGQISPVSNSSGIKPLQLDTFESSTFISTDSVVPANIDIKSGDYKKEVFVKPSTKYRLKLIKHVDGDLEVSLCGLKALLNNEQSSAIITTPERINENEYLTFNGWGDIEKVMLAEADNFSDFTDGFESVAENEPLEILSSDYLGNSISNILMELDEPLRRFKNVSDTIEFRDGTWCIVRRIGQVEVGAGDGWLYSYWSQHTTKDYVSFYAMHSHHLGLYPTGYFVFKNVYCQCNMFIKNETAFASADKECFFLGNGSNPPYFGVRVNRKRVNGISVEAFREFFTKNKVTFVAELMKPKIIPLNKVLSMESFNKFTKIVSSNNVRPTIEASIPSNLGATIRNDVERIARIEDTINRVLLPIIVDVDYNKTLLEVDYNIAKSKGE